MNNDKKIRVLHVLPWIRGGGVERRRAILAEGYADDTYELRVLGLSVGGAAADRIARSTADLVNCGGVSLTSVRAWKQVALEIRSFRPHIIHGAVFEGNILAATLGALLRVPIVVLEETSLPIYRKPRAERLFQTLALAADRVVAISPQVADYVREKARVPARKVATITNGVEPLEIPSSDEREAARARWEIPQDALVLGTLSRLVDDENKRISDVIRALPAVLDRQPNAHLLVCGDGRARPELESLVSELGLGEKVTFAGTVIAKDGLAAMDIFVHVASHEGFGFAVAEAAFCALPIVTTGVGGIAEIVVADETALLVSVGSTDEIAHALVTLMEDPTRRRAFGAADRARALERFSAQRWVNDLESLYQELLKEKGLV